VVKNYEGLYRPKGGELADESDNPFSITDKLERTLPKKIGDQDSLTKPVMRPNLVLCSVGPPKLMEKHMDPNKPGFANFNFVVGIRNAGNADSKSCYIEVVFDGGGGDIRKIPPIKAGEWITEMFIIHTRLDDSLSVSYTVWIDKQNLVNELNEWDNKLPGVLSATTEEYAHCSDDKDHYPSN